MEYPFLEKSLFGRIKQRIRLEYQVFRQETLEFEKVKIRLNKGLSKKIYKALCYGYYEFEELQILRKYLSKDDLVFELGTGLGLISAYCSRSIGSEKVFTYEANPFMKKLINDTYWLNNVNPQLDICLLGENTGEAVFFIEEDFWISSTVQHTTGARSVKIPVKSFNREIYRINPTFLILDIEGGEYELFQFADFHDIRKILIEIHDDILGLEKTRFVLNTLITQGFRINEEISSKNVSFWQR
ncbi:FkbM family methyltransferase [Lyngbya confervoides]|uniref:FkbM family methyltransferase n=1 Tax=Lyngbya confervoides BDU141951 TaxID=1574623 RepID=A0ABD4T762_9CYAN|nr:FkbM family methyltransferase [Lyngbya confervoides]MCM1984606.1 FkbM family methyltransferase [Lyngbya confervoides BDU141951]